MYYYAMLSRDTVRHADGSPLEENDLKVLSDACEVTETVNEPSNDIMAIRLNDNTILPESYQKVVLRELFAQLPAQEVFRLSRAKALLEWRANTRFCGHCGTPLQDDPIMTARVCPNCHRQIFPRIEPCIILRIEKDGKILLARHVQRNQNIYACIAGFVEAGETLEQAVVREVKEETGITVQNVRYFGSQSWPFPSQLMIGFTAEYKSGEIKLQAEELSDAQWFDPTDCPASPQPGSIAYRLIHMQTGK